MSAAVTNRIAQSILCCVWVIIIAVEFTSPVTSQTCTVPTYGNPITISVNSWIPGTQVAVQIDDTFSSDKSSGLAAGNEKWNNPALISCSGVRFQGFKTVSIAP